MSPSEAMHQTWWSNRLSPGRRVRVEQAALAAGGHRHADRVADALAERAGGGLDAGGVPVLGVARGQRAPGPQRLEVVELEPVAGQVELDVEREAGVAGGEDEPVAAGPVRVGRVVPQVALEEQVRRRREAHRRAGVAVADLLDRVHGQRPGRCRPPAGRGRSTPRFRRWLTARQWLLRRSDRRASVPHVATLATISDGAYRASTRPTRFPAADTVTAAPEGPARANAPPDQPDDEGACDGRRRRAAEAAVPSVVDRRRRTRRQAVGGYVALTKPRIIELLLVTTVPTMFLAEGGMPSLWLGRRHPGRRHARRGQRQRAQLLPRPRHRPGDAPHRAAAAGDRRWSSPREALVFGVVLGVAGGRLARC